MGDIAGLVIEIVAFVCAWTLIALAVAFGFGQVCRWADRRAARERALRELLAEVGRMAQADRRLAMVANVEGLVRDVRYARQTARLQGDVRRARLVAVEDIDRMAG